MVLTGLREEAVPSLGIELRTISAPKPRTLIVHDIGQTADQHQEVARRYDAVVYDRRGYGASTAPEPYGGTTVEEQAEDAHAILQLCRPAHVAGIGFGALIAMQLDRRSGADVRHLVLVDPLLIQLTSDGAEWLSATRQQLEEDIRAKGPQPAVDHFTQTENAIAPRAFFADFAALPTWVVTRRELRAIATPATIATTPGASSLARRSAEQLAELLPNATTLTGDLAEALSAAGA